LNSNIDTNFLNWLGGFFDGEGSFTVSIHKHPGMMLKHQISPSIEITQSECSGWVLEAIHNTIGLGKIARRERNGTTTYPNCKDQITWRIRDMEQVSTFTKLIFPYLVLKKGIADKFLVLIDMWNKGWQETPGGFIQICMLRDQLNNHRTKGPSYLNADYFVKYFAENPISEKTLKDAKHYRRRPKYLKNKIEG
jgi:hypothetical protein